MFPWNFSPPPGRAPRAIPLLKDSGLDFLDSRSHRHNFMDNWDQLRPQTDIHETKPHETSYRKPSMYLAARPSIASQVDHSTTPTMPESGPVSLLQITVPVPIW